MKVQYPGLLVDRDYMSEGEVEKKKQVHFQGLEAEHSCTPI
jgi:hypothetical protein